MASLAERDHGLALGGIAGLGRERGIAGGLLLERRELVAVEERRRIGGAHDPGALAELAPGGVAAGGSEDQRRRELPAGEGAGHVRADLGRLALYVPDPVFGEGALRAAVRRRPADRESGQLLRLGGLRGAGELAVLIGTEDAGRVARQRDMGPDTDRSRLGGNHHVVDLRTHVGPEGAAREIEVQHARSAEDAVVIVDLAVETDPGLHRERAFEDEARLRDGLIGTIKGQDAAEHPAELGGDRRELRAVAQGDRELFGDGDLDVGDGDGLIGEAGRDGLGPGLRPADAVEHHLAVVHRQGRVKPHRQHGGLRSTGGHQRTEGEVRYFGGGCAHQGRDRRGVGRAELLQAEERLAT